MSPSKFNIPCESFQLIRLFSYYKYTCLVYRNKQQMTRLQEQEFISIFLCEIQFNSNFVYLMYICGYVDDKLYCLHNKPVYLLVYLMRSHNKIHILYFCLVY